MDSVDKYLFTPYGILLNAPSYTVPNDDIGFVTRVYPGLKENGSIFSHRIRGHGLRSACWDAATVQ